MYLHLKTEMLNAEKILKTLVFQIGRIHRAFELGTLMFGMGGFDGLIFSRLDDPLFNG